MEIRDTTMDDAAQACEVLRRSISELCFADHRNDPAILDRWLANKTPENVAAWITNTEDSVLVAVAQQQLQAEPTRRTNRTTTMNLSP